MTTIGTNSEHAKKLNEIKESLRDQLTRDDILAMEPKELDKLISEKVMGWKCNHRNCDGEKLIRCGACGASGHGNCFGNGMGAIQITCNHMPNYSEDLSAAWEVVKKMRADNWTFCLTGEKEKWSAIFYWDPNKSFPEVIHKSEATAICQCALLAVLDL